MGRERSIRFERARSEPVEGAGAGMTEHAFVEALGALLGDARLLWLPGADGAQAGASRTADASAVSWSPSLTAGDFTVLGAGTALACGGSGPVGSLADAPGYRFGLGVADAPFTLVGLVRPAVNNAAMDAPYDAGDDACFQGLAPVLTFNGVDERATLPDSSAWSTGAGSADAPFSVGEWVNPIKVVSWYLLSKGPASGTDQEWRFGNPEGVGRYGLYLVDASANAACHRLANVAFDAGRWAFVTATYDGTGGASAANGIRVYVDGADVSDTPVNNASYVAMENTVHGVVLGARWTSGSSYDRFLEGGLAGGPLGPFFTKKALSPAEVRALYGLGRASMGL